nr:relaxase/mobilization nuclease domain-containing protein [Nitrosomonas nitrosa]
MILVGNQRGGAKNLALHLMKQENEHIEIHELRGFASENLMAALNEAYAMSRATKCKQYLFSLSLNPPPGENVETPFLEDAIARAEKSLGLTGQPRAIVFHEKHGRRHAHAVWSRINAQEMKAIQLSYSHNKLKALAKELFIERGWEMPRGFIDTRERDPKNFTLAEWQQAKRIGKDPRAIKADFQDSWAISDSRAAFAQALKRRGYWLSRGDKRGYVAIDFKGEIYAVPKWVGIKTRQVRDRLGDANELPSVAQAKAQMAQELVPALQKLKEAEDAKAREQHAAFEQRRMALIAKQRAERESLLKAQETRRIQETKWRQERYRTGLKGLWDRLRGEHGRIRKENERDAYGAMLRDRREKDAFIFRHLAARRQLEALRQQERKQSIEARRELKRDISDFKNMRAQRFEEFKRARRESPREASRQKGRGGPEPSR